MGGLQQTLGQGEGITLCLSLPDHQTGSQGNSRALLEKGWQGAQEPRHPQCPGLACRAEMHGVGWALLLTRAPYYILEYFNKEKPTGKMSVQITGCRSGINGQGKEQVASAERKGRNVSRLRRQSCQQTQGAAGKSPRPPANILWFHGPSPHTRTRTERPGQGAWRGDPHHQAGASLTEAKPSLAALSNSTFSR